MPLLIKNVAMIHTIRKQRSYEKAVVYGIVSDGRDYTFLRIDNERHQGTTFRCLQKYLHHADAGTDSSAHGDPAKGGVILLIIRFIL